MLMHIHSSNCLHGQIFDNRKRWCANCDKTVVVETEIDSYGFAYSSKKCSDCNAIWPEYVEEFLEGFQDDPMYQVIFGIGETLH